MTAPTHLRLLRWGVPVVAAAAVAAVVSGVFTAEANPSLPAKSAGQLLVDLQRASVDGLSGTVVQDSDLGLPQLPQVGSGSSSLTSLLTGSHTLRVWYAGDDKQRVALLGSLGETDVVRNGTNAWVWSSESNSATHYTIPAGKQGKHEADGLPAGVARMNFPKFLVYSFLGSFPWSLGLAWAGAQWKPRDVREWLRQVQRTCTRPRPKRCHALGQLRVIGGMALAARRLLACCS